jgi:preprotein translocase subunit SecG
MLLDLLLTLNILVCLALIGVVLLQRSEGGALGGGGSPTGLVTSRGAGDLLTRATWVLFALFLTLSLSLTLLGGRERSNQAIINRLKLQSIDPDAAAAARRAATSPGLATPPPVSGTGTETTGLSAPKPTVHLPGADPAAEPESPGFRVPAPAVNLPPSPPPKNPNP